MISNSKYSDLFSHLKKMGNVAVAFSGGVDSTFLLFAAKEALGSSVLALTVRSPYIADWEIEEAETFCKQFDIRHRIVAAGISDKIKNNPVDRCYLCKKHIFSTLIKIARSEGIDFVLDGTNHDDPSDHRPGLRALKELDIRSPLLETGITKSEIRTFSRELGLPSWDKPPYACLLTRLPHGTKIKTEELRRIETAEKYIMDLGYKAVRVRSHGDLARIEVDQEIIPEIIRGVNAEKIVGKLREIGYDYVTIDMQGYRTGSFNLKTYRYGSQ